jgi:hypothetical protein
LLLMLMMTLNMLIDVEISPGCSSLLGPAIAIPKA